CYSDFGVVCRQRLPLLWQPYSLQSLPQRPGA
ncbi:hypothetical protein BN1708_019462, partial [Verticillium longisporum]